MNEIIIVINGNKWEIKAASNKIDENILDIYIEKNSDRLRKKYLDFVEGLAKKKIGEKALCDYFKISKGYNIWWMSLIVEKSVFKSPCIVSCIKLLALEEIINIHKIDKLTVKGSDKNIINSIRELTANLGIRFKTERKLNLFNIKDYLNPRELYNSAPQILRAYLFFLRQFFSKWVWINLLYRRYELSAVKIPRVFTRNNKNFFFTHLKIFCFQFEVLFPMLLLQPAHQHLAQTWCLWSEQSR